MFYPDRFNKLFCFLNEKKIDAVAIGPSGTLEYLTGFNPGGCERFQALFILKDQRFFYICNKIYSLDTAKYYPANTPFYVWGDNTTFHDTLSRAFKDFGLEKSRIAIGDGIAAADLIEMKTFFSGNFSNGLETLEELRIIKTEIQLDQLRKAARIADDVMEDLTRFILPGMREKVIKAKIVELFESKGAQGISFDPIVACGVNSASPHYNGDAGVIADQDVLLLDFGCRYHGFCSDISRTFFIGDITREQEDLYKMIRKAQETAVSHAKEGHPANAVDKAARDVIESKGYGRYFLNRTGHGIGTDVHEAPYINGHNTRPLERGMAFSVEPGISIPGKFGMRIEDIVVINHAGETEVLNQFPKDIIVL